MIQQAKQTNVAKDYGLSETSYSFGHNLRLKHSSFKQNTMKWLLGNNSELIPADTPKILSLGCGDGVFDIEFIDSLRQQKEQLKFSGLDFNATDLEHFRENLSVQDESLQKSMTLHYKKFEPSTNLGEHYDFIYMVHFLHSFEDVLPVIQNALKHLVPGGKLLIIQQNKQGIYELKRKFKNILPNQKFQITDRVKTLLQAEKIAFTSHTIDTYFDISIMKEMSLDTLLLMSFCFTNDLSVLDTQQQEEIRKAFLAYASVQKNGSHIIYEPMEAIICEA
jgi:ubiquinone/menaquinone biosynthesis C-methylase UbiE